MGLLREIQASLMQQGQDIGPILLKLRFLASRLGSGPFEEWVKHESEGYPRTVEVPDYRKISVSYSGTFFGPFGSRIENAPILPFLIAKFAGQKWLSYEVRQSISGIDNLIGATRDSAGTLNVNSSNLMLLLQGKVYQGYACNSVVGDIAKTALVEIQNVVRTKVFELTLELERLVPAAVDIDVGLSALQGEGKEVDVVTNITQQIVHGNVTSISNSGDRPSFNLSVCAGDESAFAKSLVGAGVSEADAEELAKIVASEEPESKEEPFGTKAKAWFKDNIGKAVDGTWNVGVAVATKVLTEAVMKYYGLK
jgi:hypothetical protein